jgi:hypothetical protein
LKEIAERVRILIKGEMKNTTKVVSVTLFFSVFIIFISCVQKQEKVERIIEDGVEVVVNHIEPYKIKGEPSTFNLEEEFIIDTEKDEITDIGLVDIDNFDVDSEGNIFLSGRRNKENFIFKFDKNGHFVTSFGRRGQGPGEISNVMLLIVTDLDEIAISGVTKVLIFDKKGELIKETRKDKNLQNLIPLKNENFLIIKTFMDSTDFSTVISADLYTSKLAEIKELDRVKIESPIKGKGINAIPPYLFWSVLENNIYIGNTETDYEIQIYDLEGNLLRKIRKEYQPVQISEEDMEKIKKRIERYPEEIRKKVYIPKHMPPFQDIFSDDLGRLYVKTYEQGETPEYVYDIFNPEGIFIGRKSLMDQQVKANRDCLYCLREKESGYKELIVYKMRWD